MSLNPSRTSMSHNVPDDVLDGIFSDKDKKVDATCSKCGCSCKTGGQHLTTNNGTTDNKCAGFETGEKIKQDFSRNCSTW